MLSTQVLVGVPSPNDTNAKFKILDQQGLNPGPLASRVDVIPEIVMSENFLYNTELCVAFSFNNIHLSQQKRLLTHA